MDVRINSKRDLLMGTSFMALVIAGSGVPHPDIPGFMGNESLTFPPAPERSPGGAGGGGGKGGPGHPGRGSGGGPHNRVFV